MEVSIKSRIGPGRCWQHSLAGAEQLLPLLAALRARLPRESTSKEGNAFLQKLPTAVMMRVIAVAMELAMISLHEET